MPKRKSKEQDGDAAKMLDNDEVEIEELIGEGGMAKVFGEHGEK